MDAAPAFRVRTDIFTGPRTFRLTDDALTWEEDGKPLDGVFLDEIAGVHMRYAPTRFAGNRYVTRIAFRKGGSVELTNMDFRGFADFVALDADYTLFLRALHERLAVKGRDVAYRKGSGAAGYVANAVLTVFILAMIALAFVLLFNLGFVWIAVVKLAIILFFVPTLFRYLRRAKPGTYDPLRLPEDSLPA